MSSATVADIATQPGKPLLTRAFPSARIEALTGLRFIAAFCILFAHATNWVAPFRNSDVIAGSGAVISIYGMPLFFVLSGFVIQYSYGSLFQTTRFRWAAAEFLGARFARLYPLFIFFFLVGLVVDETAGWFPSYFSLWARMSIHFITMTQSWFYMINFDDKMIMDNAFGLSWSISTEFFFYTCFLGLVYFVLRLKSVCRCALVALTLSLSVICFFVYLRSHIAGFEYHAKEFIPDFVTMQEKWSDSFIRWLFYYAPYSRVFEFILGGLTARLYVLALDQPITRLELTLSKVALVMAGPWLLGFGAAHAFPQFFGGRVEYLQFLALNFGCAPPIAAIMFCVSRYPNWWLSRILSASTIVALGEISYSIYVVHTWTLRIFVRDPIDMTPAFCADAILRIGLGIALTLVLATATYRLIEVPGRRKLRALADGMTVRCFGPRAANLLPVAAARTLPIAAPIAGLVMLLLACIAYQLSYKRDSASVHEADTSPPGLKTATVTPRVPMNGNHVVTLVAGPLVALATFSVSIDLARGDGSGASVAVSPSGSATTLSETLIDQLPILPASYNWEVLWGLNVKPSDDAAVVAGQRPLQLTAVPPTVPANEPNRHAAAIRCDGLAAGAVYRIAAWVRSAAGTNVQLEVRDSNDPKTGQPAGYGEARFNLTAHTTLSATDGLRHGVDQAASGWSKVWVDLKTADGRFYALVGLLENGSNQHVFNATGQQQIEFGGIELTRRQAND